VRRIAAITLLALVPGFSLAARAPRHGHKETSWNRAITCTPFTSTAADVVAGRVKPGIGDPASITPPCELQHKSPFVILFGMKLVGSLSRVCAEGDTTFCDTVFTAEDPVAPAVGAKFQRIRCVIDREWKRSLVAPPDPGRDETVVDLQGYAYMNPATRQWEIHPVTAWRRAAAATPAAR
jgi:hypothetical protein